jgi:hypothetical protein
MTFGQAFENCKFNKRMRLKYWYDDVWVEVEGFDGNNSGFVKVSDGSIISVGWLPNEKEIFSNEWELID